MQALVQTRLKYLQQGVQQQKNALTGKRGTETTFENMQQNGGGVPAAAPPDGGGEY